MRDRPALDLFVISWLVLFLELACIRWFPSHVLFLTFFTNTVLLACFVGMSIGCLIARRPGRQIRFTPYLLLLGVFAGLLCDRYSDDLRYIFAVGDQKKGDVVYFGTEASAYSKPNFTIPIEFVGAFFFFLIAAVMVGPGQEMGRAFNRVANRTTAYSANLLGSLVGIGLFAASSYLRLPPVVWFGACAVVMVWLLVREDPDAFAGASETQPRPPEPGAARPNSLVPAVCVLGVVAMTAMTSGFTKGPGKRETTWSPYYRIDYYPTERFINTNLISQQVMEPRNSVSVAPYALPYLFQRDLKKADGSPEWPEFKRILIIGAGSGNDVARALHWVGKDARIDAVEIDPVIQKLGAADHPDKPFADERVHVYLNDGRNFLRESPPETYDLVVFALIDSLVLQSGYSNLRLESQLFTLESFQDVRRVLKPTGVYAVYNFFRQGWIAARIRDQLRSAFDGSDPIGMTTSVMTQPRAEITLDTSSHHEFTLFFAGRPEVLAPIRAAFGTADSPVRYWYPWKTGVDRDTKARFSATPPPEPPPPSEGRKFHDPEGKEEPPEWYGLRIARVEETGGMRQATDDWPFLYSREAAIPGLTARGVALMLVLSVILWFVFGGNRALASESGTKPEWGTMLRSFFLGAGFMLVETKAVVQMAILFGGTWMVNTVVFAAILVMALAGNLYAGKVNPRRLEPYYVGLFIALGVGLLVPPGMFLGMSPTLQILAVCLIVFTPIAFAGVIFATTFKRTSQPDRVFGANIAGALVGGLSENASVMLGFTLLLCVAVGYYALSAAFGNREAAVE
jgi:SAM-dependent methyltransferase